MKSGCVGISGAQTYLPAGGDAPPQYFGIVVVDGVGAFRLYGYRIPGGVGWQPVVGFTVDRECAVARVGMGGDEVAVHFGLLCLLAVVCSLVMVGRLLRGT